MIAVEVLNYDLLSYYRFIHRFVAFVMTLVIGYYSLKFSG